jgi:ribosomal protein S18 acetylase RimI-like enzyme
MEIGVRDASDSDLRFVRRLATEAILYTIPYGRTTPNSAVQARVRENLRDLAANDDLAVLVAYRQDNAKPIGYLILQLNELDQGTGDRQSYIFDLAVEPRYWGTPAVRLLVHEAARRTAQAGLQMMAGEITAHNERTYLQALRLGFELERFKIVMNCSESGPVPMPRRPEEQRAYQASRQKKGGRESSKVPATYRQARQARAAGKPANPDAR